MYLTECYLCRLLWAVQYFVGAGFYVIPTYSPADHSVDNLVTSTPALFLRIWANLWTAITEVTCKLLPVLPHMLFISVHSCPPRF